MRILFLGDIVGRPGRTLVAERASSLRRELDLDLLLANAENASSGLGLTARNASELLDVCDALTTGNHVWRYKDLAQVPEDVKVRIIDMHAEASSEKIGLALHLDGQASAVLGTHTHVQTADACVLPNGTGFLTDLGMCGPFPSCLGMEPAGVLRRFLTGLPERFEVAEAPARLRGALLTIDEATGRCETIEAWAEG